MDNTSSIDATIDSLAKKIVARQLEVPALFFLEMQKPVTSLIHTSTLAIEPLVTPLFGSERIAPLQNLFAERANVERLIERIETLSGVN